MLADYGYDNLGNRTGVVFGNGAGQAFSFDPVGRLSQLTNDLSGTTNDLTATFAYNPASQIASTTRTGDAYAWTGHGNGSTAYTQNGLNQQATVGGAAAAWDSKGNLTTEPQSGKTYGYSSENLLTSSSGGTAATLNYDPALRLSQTVGAATTKFLYDGPDAIAEYNGTGALQRRFIFDPTTGQPVLWYEGTGTAATNRRYLSQDERGSVISVSDSTSASLGLNTYDEYGKPGASNLGRYQYTGQKWIGEAGLYDYKARDYLPQWGIFAQTDPIGYADSPNLYAYVLDDPVNLVDPSGMMPMWCSAGGSPWGICSEHASGVIENWLTWRDSPGSPATDRDPPVGPGGAAKAARPRTQPPEQRQCGLVQQLAGTLATSAEHFAEGSNLASDVLWLGGGVSAGVGLIQPETLPISGPIALSLGALAGVADGLSLAYRGFSVTMDFVAGNSGRANGNIGVGLAQIVPGASISKHVDLGHVLGQAGIASANTKTPPLADRTCR